MLKLSQSFRMGNGCLEHNLRITKGAGVRQNGYKERRHLNENIIVKGDITQPDYERNLLLSVVKEKIGDELNVLNEHQIQSRHPERVVTLEQWVDKKAYVRGGKQRRLIKEYIIGLGNRHTNCPYIQNKDSDGNLLDKKNKIIPLWDTRRMSAISPTKGYDKNGNIKESKICKKTKAVYRDFVTAFQKANPQAEIVGASIHADEGGACHMHLSVVWWSKLKPLKNGKKQGVGWGIAETAAIRQQYEDRGIHCNNERKDNAQSRWRKDMRQLLQDVAYQHGIERLDMKNKEPYRELAVFGAYKDHYCGELEKEYDKVEEAKKAVSAQKEALEAEKQAVDEMMVSDIAKGEWYYLKKYYGDIYKDIHERYVNDRTKIRLKQQIERSL